LSGKGIRRGSEGFRGGEVTGREERQTDARVPAVFTGVRPTPRAVLQEILKNTFKVN